MNLWEKAQRIVHQHKTAQDIALNEGAIVIRDAFARHKGKVLDDEAIAEAARRAMRTLSAVYEMNRRIEINDDYESTNGGTL